MVPLSGLFLLQLLQRSPAATGAHLQPRLAATIPDYVNTYAPLVHLDQNELYLPSDIGLHLNHTFPALNTTAIPNPPSPLSLSNLDQLNAIGNCTPANIATCPIYLTSKDNVTSNPPWLNGVLPDPTTHETIGAKSCAIIVTDHNNGVVDAFYMYFYAFNQGLTVNGQVLGDHVGDWEHTMVRFSNGTPTAVWLSQHDSGQAITYAALTKTGGRPLIYSAQGTHANYAVPGTHSRTIATVVVNDTTSTGPLWDPVLSAYYYTYTPSPNSSSAYSSSTNGTANGAANGTFSPTDPSTPTSYLSFLGHWGDARYPAADPRQVNFLNLGVAWKYESGPTGPLDKGLVRKEVCPDTDGGKECTTLSVLPAVSGSSVPVTVSRPGATGTGSSVGVSASATVSAGAMEPTGKSAGASVGRRMVGGGWVLKGAVGVVWMGFVGAGVL